MDFLGIGLPEIILILVVALIVVGPQRLPEAAIQIARALRVLRRYATDVTSQIREEFEEVSREYEEMRSEVRQLRESVDKDVGSLSREVNETLRQTRQSIRHEPVIETTAEPAPQEEPPQPNRDTA